LISFLTKVTFFYCIYKCIYKPIFLLRTSRKALIFLFFHGIYREKSQNNGFILYGIDFGNLCKINPFHLYIYLPSIHVNYIVDLDILDVCVIFLIFYNMNQSLLHKIFIAWMSLLLQKEWCFYLAQSYPPILLNKSKYSKNIAEILSTYTFLLMLNKMLKYYLITSLANKYLYLKLTCSFSKVRGVLGNKCAGQHNLKTVQIREVMWK
jgi:hypothetical protein